VQQDNGLIQKLALWHQVSSANYLGPMRFRTLWECFGSDIGKLLNMTEDELRKLKGIVTSQNLQSIRGQASRFPESLAFMQAQVQLAGRCDGQVLAMDDQRYPKFLRQSKMCHPIVFCAGDPSPFASYDKAVAIVGTRNPAPESADFALRAARELASRGWVVVSGMAKGVDSCAHRGALAAGGKTIAVLGCGPDVVYPRELAGLHEEIRTKGLVLSEFPFGTKPEDWKLRKRNKTTVALATATVIVQSSTLGGTMNAWKACKEQHKTAFVLVPSWACDYSGNQRAISEGARPVSTVAELVGLLEEELTAAKPTGKQGQLQLGIGPEAKRPRKTRSVKKSKATAGGVSSSGKLHGKAKRRNTSVSMSVSGDLNSPPTVP